LEVWDGNLATRSPRARSSHRCIKTARDSSLRTVGGVLVVQGGAGAGVPGPLHQLGQGDPGARGERHRGMALVVPRQVVAADGSTGSREHRRSAAARERGANSEHQDLSKAGPPQTGTLRSMQAVSVPVPHGRPNWSQHDGHRRAADAQTQSEHVISEEPAQSTDVRSTAELQLDATKSAEPKLEL